MNLDHLESILTLFEQCQSQGKPLELDIGRDLMRILPGSHSLLVDILNDAPANAFTYVSHDEKILYFQNNLSLCLFDQTSADSCRSTSCRQLHLCSEYLSEQKCAQLQSMGKCSQSHSLATKHNQSILTRFHLADDERVFQLIARLTRLSASTTAQTPLKKSTFFVQSMNKRPMSDESFDALIGLHRELLTERKRIDPSTMQVTFEDEETASMMRDLLERNHSNTTVIKERLTPITPDFKDSSNEKSPQPLENNTSPSVSSKPAPTLGRGFSNQLRNLDADSKASGDSSSPGSFCGRGRGRFTTTAATSPAQPTVSFSYRLRSMSSQRLSTSSPTVATSPTLNSSPKPCISPSSPQDHATSRSIPIIRSRKGSETALRDHSSEVSVGQESNVDVVAPSETPSSDGKRRPTFVLRQGSLKNRESMPTFFNYTYSNSFRTDHLCYLLGPGRRRIVEKDLGQVLACLPSGYCTVRSVEQGREIERELRSILPQSLNISVMKIPDEMALLVRSSAAERLFEQNQTQYAIVSEPKRFQLNIETIGTPASQRSPSPPASNSDTPDDTSFHISKTDSSIDVISGDICEVKVDMMVCISTSNTLRDSVLRRAGAKTAAEFKKNYNPQEVLVLDGGSTAARKIFFVPWQTEIEETDEKKIQKSLSGLVKWCLDEAHTREVKTISFPPMGTGQLNIDSWIVCEALVGTASEHLHQYSMHVKFVVYSSSNNDNDNECYQVFRLYLDSLRDQVTSRKTFAAETNRSAAQQRQTLRRDVPSKRLSTLSEATSVAQQHQALLNQLTRLQDEKTLDLTRVSTALRVDSSFQVDSIIDICMDYHVWPRIDFSRSELILRGDRESCLQCCHTLSRLEQVHQYSYAFADDEVNFSSYASLKIDEAFAVRQSTIRIEEDDQSVFEIDVNRMQIRSVKSRQVAALTKKPLGMQKRIIRTQRLAASTYEALECIRLFHETLPDWQIEQVEAIENDPLDLHFISRKKDHTSLCFHGCSYSSVQSIIHYGLHSSNASNYGEAFQDRTKASICVTRDVLSSHLHGTRRSTAGKHYLFAVQVAKNDANQFIVLANEEACLALPAHLIVYQRKVDKF